MKVWVTPFSDPSVVAAEEGSGESGTKTRGAKRKVAADIEPISGAAKGKKIIVIMIHHSLPPPSISTINIIHHHHHHLHPHHPSSSPSFFVLGGRSGKSKGKTSMKVVFN